MDEGEGRWGRTGRRAGKGKHSLDVNQLINFLKRCDRSNSRQKQLNEEGGFILGQNSRIQSVCPCGECTTAGA